LPISQRPTIQKAMAASTLMASSSKVVLMKFCRACIWIEGMSMSRLRVSKPGNVAVG
jgi:hypothetical protein